MSMAQCVRDTLKHEGVSRPLSSSIFAHLHLSIVDLLSLLLRIRYFCMCVITVSLCFFWRGILSGGLCPDTTQTHARTFTNTRTHTRTDTSFSRSHFLVTLHYFHFNVCIPLLTKQVRRFVINLTMLKCNKILG